MKLSIIIPVYNVEKYLERCILSILNQEFFSLSDKNIEILLINDGSPDQSQLIIDKYDKTYNFIKGYSKKNGGVSDARNYGLTKATGDYVWFVDSDDWIDSKALTSIFREIENNELDILEFDSFSAKETNDGKTSLSLNSFYHSIRTDNISGIDALEMYGYIVGVCFKVIKRQLFIENKLLFPIGELNEECIIAYRLMKYSNNYKKITLPLYYYYSRDISTTNNKNKKHLYRYLNDQINNIFILNRLIKEENFSTDKIKEMLYFYTTNVLFSIFQLKDSGLLMKQLGDLEEAGLYPIKKYSYHNSSFKRKIFVYIINQKWLIKKIL